MEYAKVQMLLQFSLINLLFKSLENNKFANTFKGI